MTGSPNDSVDLVRRFVAERCELAADYRVPCAELYADWREWCGRQQLPTASTNVFGRWLRATVPGLGGVRVRVNGASVGCYTGLRLRAEPPAARSLDGSDAALTCHALRVAGERVSAATTRLLEQVNSGDGWGHLTARVTALIVATRDFGEAAKTTAVAAIEWSAAQTDRALNAAERERARADRAEAELRAAESVAAQVLGARLDRGTGIVTLSGVIDGPSDAVPDA